MKLINLGVADVLYLGLCLEDFPIRDPLNDIIELINFATWLNK